MRDENKKWTYLGWRIHGQKDINAQKLREEVLRQRLEDQPISKYKE